MKLLNLFKAFGRGVESRTRSNVKDFFMNRIQKDPKKLDGFFRYIDHGNIANVGVLNEIIKNVERNNK